MNHRIRILIIFFSGLVLIFGLVTIVMMNQQKEESWEPVFSTRFTDPFGTHALFRLLESQGYTVKNNFFAYDKLEKDKSGNFVIIGPKEAFSTAEDSAFSSMIKKGSWALVVASDDINPMKPFDIILETVDENPDELIQTFPKKNLEAAIPDPSLPGLDSIQFIRNENSLSQTFIRNRRINALFTHNLRSDSTSINPLLQTKDGNIQAGWFYHGNGGVVFATHPYIFTNDGLRNAANVVLVMNLFQRISAENQGPLLFDEFHQGFHIEKVASPIWIPQVRWMIWGLAATFVLAIMAGMRRQIKTVPVTREPRRSILEFVQSMGEIYSRKKGNHFIFMEICYRFVLRAKSSLGITSVDIVKNPEIAVKAAGLKWDAEESKKLAEILREIRLAYLDEKPSLALAQKMREFSIRNKLDLNVHVK